LSGGEALDDMHGFSAAGTVPEVAVRQGWWRKLLVALGGEQFMCQRQQAVTEAVGEQAVAADAHEAPG